MKWYKWKFTIRHAGEELSGKFRSLDAQDRQEAVQVLENHYGKDCVVSLEEA